jgi:hypothetical protein
MIPNQVDATSPNTAYTLRANALAPRDILLRKTSYMVGTLYAILLGRRLIKVLYKTIIYLKLCKLKKQ